MHKLQHQFPASRSLLNGVTVLTLLSIAAFATSCKKSSSSSTFGPRATYRAALEAGKKGDWEGYKRGFSQATLKQHEQLAKDKGMTVEDYYQTKVSPDFQIPEMRNEKIDGDNALVEFRVDKPARGWVRLPFIKENGEWKIATAERANDAKFIEEKIEVHLQKPAGHTMDFAHVIDDGSYKYLEELLNGLKKRRGVDFFVAIIKTTDGKDIGDYARAIAEDWGLKGEGNNLLLLLAVDDHKYQFDISRQLGSKLSTGFLKQSGELMVPSLKQRKYGEGILKSVNAIIAKLEAEFQLSISTR